MASPKAIGVAAAPRPTVPPSLTRFAVTTSDRRLATNTGTLFNAEPCFGAVPFRELFLAHYAAMRGTGARCEMPGVVVGAVALATGKLAGTLVLRARVAELQSAIVGRHEQAGLYLDDDPALALRHLAVLLDPVRSSFQDLRLRILDLRTDAHFYSEGGHELESLDAAGAVFLRCAGFALLILPTGDPTDWPEDAEDAWACLPERICLDERRCPAPARAAKPQGGGRTTFIRFLPGPGEVSEAPRLEGPAIGRLVVDVEGRRVAIAVDEPRLKRGIILGRYPRCESAAPLFSDDSGVSRVHLLVTLAGGRVWAIDTGSTHGTFARSGQRREREVRLDDAGTVLTLAGNRISVRWEAIGQIG